MPLTADELRERERARKNEGQRETGMVERICACGSRYTCHVKLKSNQWGQCFCCAECEWIHQRHIVEILVSNLRSKSISS